MKRNKISRRSCALCLLVSLLTWSYRCPAQELPPTTEDPEVAEGGIILGGVVVVAGGTMAYLLWRFCQKHFPAPPPPPPPTNAPPVNPTNALPHAMPTYALGVDVDLGSCPQHWQEGQEPLSTTSHVTVSVGAGGLIETSVLSGSGPEYVGTFSVIQDQAAQYGLEMTGHYQAPTVTVDGVVGESEVLSWLPESRTVRVQPTGAALYGILVEVSQDLFSWQPLARVECEPGFRITFSDTQQGSPWFYKVTSTLAD